MDSRILDVAPPANAGCTGLAHTFVEIAGDFAHDRPAHILCSLSSRNLRNLNLGFYFEPQRRVQRPCWDFRAAVCY